MWGNPQFAPTTATNQLYPTVNGWNCYLTGWWAPHPGPPSKPSKRPSWRQIFRFQLLFGETSHVFPVKWSPW
jgi:hypothetical protein